MFVCVRVEGRGCQQHLSRRNNDDSRQLHLGERHVSKLIKHSRCVPELLLLPESCPKDAAHIFRNLETFGNKCEDRPKNE